MSLLIDPPLWPAHGTTFSHLVSDASLTELHAFAASAGLPEQAFDRDHYDVAAREHDRLVGLGAVPVSAAELTRRLVRSGLRVPARERPDRHDAWLRRRFDELLPGRADVREELLTLWGGADRKYHDSRHLADVLRGIDQLSEVGGEDATSVRVARLAAWWHDAVYTGTAGDDEEASALLAEADLAASEPEEVIARVGAAIRMTIDHRTGTDPAQTLLADADLRVLARPEASYERYVRAVRREYASVSDPDFRQGRAAVVESLLGLPRLFGTAHGHEVWEPLARANLRRELAQLRAEA